MKKIKITAPASSLDDVKSYFKLKVEEIYLGFKDVKENKWKIANKRNEKNANFLSLENLKKVKEINPFSEVSFTLNNAFYDVNQLKNVEKQIKETRDYVDNYIIADPSIISLVKKIAPKKGIIISCIGTCFNSETAKFYAKLGAKKVILPRQFNSEEIIAIAKNNPKIKFEAMILNQFCRNVDGFCTRCHIPEGEIALSNCYIPFSGHIVNLNSTPEEDLFTAESNIKSVLQKFKPECGICFIKKFQNAGIDSLKIVGRDHTTKRKVDDVKLVQNAIKAVKKEDFENECRTLFEKRFGRKCYNNCHY